MQRESSLPPAAAFHRVRSPYASGLNDTVDGRLTHCIEHVRMPPNLLSERLIGINRYHAVSSIFKRFSPSLILFSASEGVMVRAIDEDADAGNRAALIVEIRLNEDVGDRGMLGEIWKTELSLVQVVEEGAFE